MWCSIIPLLTGLISALLGGLIGWYWLRNTKLTQALGIIGEKEGHIDSLRHDVNTHKVNIKNLSDEKHSLSVSLTDWKSQYSNLNSEFVVLGSVKTTLENDFSKFKTESALSISNLETELATWKKKFSDIEITLQNKQSELEANLKSYEVKVKEYDTQLKDSDTKYAALKANHEAEVEKFRTLTIQHNTLTAERDNLTQSVATLRLENEKNTTDWQARYSRIEGERDGISSQLKAKEHEYTEGVNSWQIRYNGLNSELNQVKEASTHSHNVWDNRFKQVEDERNHLQAQLETKEREYTEGVNSWQSKFNGVNQELNQVKEAAARANTEWDNRFKQVDSERNQLNAQLEAKEREYTEGVNSWQMRFNTVTSELSQAKEATAHANAEWGNKFKHVEGERDNLFVQLETKRREFSEGVNSWQVRFDTVASELNQVKEATAHSNTEWDNRFKQAEAERNNLHAQLQAKEREYTEGVNSWQMKLNTLTAELNQVKETSTKSGSDWENRYNTVVTERDNINNQLRSLQRNLEVAASDFENKEIELEAEIKRLQEEIGRKPQGIIARDKDEVEREQSEILNRIKNKVAKGELNITYAAWTGTKADNLKKLRGVNAFVEKKMNAAGIHSYRQVAYLSNDDQTRLNEIMELSNKKFQKEEWVFQAKRLIGLISEESPDAVLARIRTQQGGINFDRIGSASAESKDNLQLINYVTAFDEAKLNALGIFKYSQIANFNKTDVKLVNKLIEIEEGRIAQEDWTNQANYLNTSAFEATLSRIKGRRDLVEWSRIGSVDASQQEDLQVVSGIGLFIEQKLYALGIYRLEQIAKFNSSDEAEMNNILELVPGHIQGDEWVAQSKKMVKERKLVTSN